MRRVPFALLLVVGLAPALAGCGVGGVGAAAQPTPMPTAGIAQDGKVLTVVRLGSDYREPYAPKGSKIVRGEESVEMVSTREALYDASVEYIFDKKWLPAGSTIARMDVAICGHASGDFWEFYGPDAEPFELEVSQPEPDGCWHFVEADGSDPMVTVYTYEDTRLVIDRVVWTITLA